MRITFIWPWQWKAIATKTLEDLQKTRVELQKAQAQLNDQQMAIDRHLEDKRRLAEQVRAMSER